jgi:hypothetical protein
MVGELRTRRLHGLWRATSGTRVTGWPRGWPSPGSAPDDALLERRRGSGSAGAVRRGPQRAAFRGGGVDALLDDVQADAALARFGGERHEMRHGAAEPVQPGDLKSVAFGEHFHHQVESGPARLGAAGHVDVDAPGIDAAAPEGVHLVKGATLPARRVKRFLSVVPRGLIVRCGCGRQP